MEVIRAFVYERKEGNNHQAVFIRWNNSFGARMMMFMMMMMMIEYGCSNKFSSPLPTIGERRDEEPFFLSFPSV